MTHRAKRAAAILEEDAQVADEQAGVTARAWTAMVDSGLLQAPLPPEQGGDDLGLHEHQSLLRVLRLLGAADLSWGRLYEGHVNAVLLVRRFGSPEQVADLAGSVAHGALSAVWGAESATPLQAAATADGWELCGSKILASGAGLITRPLVPVLMDGGHLLFLPELERGTRADLSGWTAQGMRSSATGRVDFTGLRVAARHVVGRRGDFIRQPWFSGGAWRFCAVHLGAAERLVDLFRAHLKSRGHGDDPFQLQRVAQATTAVTTAALWVAEAARRLVEKPGDVASDVAFANLTRGVTERAALDVLELVHRGVGLNGFVRPNPIERLSRDLATYLRQPVPDLAMTDAARAILNSSRETASLWDACS